MPKPVSLRTLNDQIVALVGAKAALTYTGDGAALPGWAAGFQT